MNDAMDSSEPIDASAADDTHDWSIDPQDMPDDADARRLAEEIARARGHCPRPEPPNITVDDDGVATWHEENANDEGLPQVLHWRLEKHQYEAYKLLTRSGEKKLLTFLGGKGGGTGKSLLIRLVALKLKSLGDNVILVAPSAKAARLIGGITVHRAFMLSAAGGFFQKTRLLSVGQDHVQWLASADVVICDEISMLTGRELSGIDDCLNFVDTAVQTIRTRSAFGNKSVIAVGDLYQLRGRAVRTEDEVWSSTAWNAFRFFELTEGCRQDDLAFRMMLSHARRGHERLTDADRTTPSEAAAAVG